MRRQITGILLTGALALSTGIALAPAAHAKNDDSRARGVCDKGSTYSAKVKDKKGGLRVDFTVKNNAVGQAWAYTVTQNGAQVVSSTGTSKANDDNSSDDTRHTAEVKFRSVLTNNAGADTLVLRAVNATTGEICSAPVTH